ncbi:hypothetical protein AVEN_171480-1 [Araneus ventricosus]|uniref:Transmembrane protein n=1 Tax=Araneus ventricosus TaxID=182803 RepID=A0A4Y2HB12_ARAVE|nr:hypothetical protein AVEN_171480-1 [Araneus ventricosus]
MRFTLATSRVAALLPRTDLLLEYNAMETDEKSSQSNQILLQKLLPFDPLVCQEFGGVPFQMSSDSRLPPFVITLCVLVFSGGLPWLFSGRNASELNKQTAVRLSLEQARDARLSPSESASSALQEDQVLPPARSTPRRRSSTRLEDQKMLPFSFTLVTVNAALHHFRFIPLRSLLEGSKVIARLVKLNESLF